MHFKVISCLSIILLASVAWSQNISASHGRYRSVAYFVDWAIYARNYHPQNLTADKLTHVLYAFADVIPTTGEVYLFDHNADVGMHYPTDPQNNAGNNLYGCLNQLYLLKKSNRKLKVLLSIGGWTLSSNFTEGTSTKEHRKMFAASAVKLVTDLGLDGLDIDWEYPHSQAEATNLVDLLCEVRSELNRSSKEDPGEAKFLLTVAAPAAPSNYEMLQIKKMDQYLDFWNLMGYDYAGSWDQMTGHMANVRRSSQNPESTKASSDQAIDYYISQGVRADKIVLGMPLYGRAFLETGGPGESFNGVAPSGWTMGPGNWEPGVWDYKALPHAGAHEHELTDILASYSYDESRRVMISYDTKKIAAMKGEYIKKRKLGGAMWWESSGDKTGNDSLIATVVDTFGGVSALDQTQNRLSYRRSIYDNIREA